MPAAASAASTKNHGGLKPRRRLLPISALGLLLWAPIPVHAHAPLPGLGEVINGFLHPLTSPVQILLIIALALVAGRQPIPALKSPFWTFAPISALALAVTIPLSTITVHAVIPVGLAMIAAAWTALDRMPRRENLCILFAAGAATLGLDSAVDTTLGWPRLRMLVANWASLNLLVFDLAIYVSLAGTPGWLRLGFRIAASWIIAIGLLTLAFAARQ